MTAQRAREQRTSEQRAAQSCALARIPPPVPSTVAPVLPSTRRHSHPERLERNPTSVIAEARDVQETLDALITGTLHPLEAPTEAAWSAIWHRRQIGSRQPFLSAILGGALADRLAWVFAAGYQAALARIFPELPMDDDWACLAVSEDPPGASRPGSEDPDAHAPAAARRAVTLTADGAWFRLSGVKTWIAASDHVRNLVVGVGSGEDQLFAIVERDAPGVTIDTGPRRPFLGDLSQGVAHFEDVLVGPDRIVERPRRARLFGVAEPLHVHAALNAFILAHTTTAPRAGGEPAAPAAPPELAGRALASIVAATGAASIHPGYRGVNLALVGLDAQTRATADLFEAWIETADPALHRRWLIDRRLVDMFTAGILRREEKLRAEARTRS